MTIAYCQKGRPRVYKPVMVAVMAITVILIVACGDDSGSSQIEEAAGAVEDIADIKAHLEGQALALKDLRLKLEDLEQRTSAAEQVLVSPPDVGDDWRTVRDAAAPELRRAIKVYAGCRAGEWSHPGGEPVDQGSGLDAAGRAVAAGLEEAVGRDIATGRMANSQAAVVRPIDLTHGHIAPAKDCTASR
jgi:hypothetical protein